MSNDEQLLEQIEKTASLSNKDFDAEMNLKNKDCKPKTVILFYSPRCGHCVRFKPTFLEFLDEVNGGKYGSDMSARIINTSADGELMKQMFSKPDEREYLVEGVPMVVSYNNGKYYSTYGPDETEEGMKKFRTKQDLIEYIQGVGSAPITYKE